MCLIAFAFKAHPEYELIVAANRDEFYERPTKAAHFWDDQSHILGGRDLKAGGTWMAVRRNGRFAAVTNYRDLSNIREDAKSRGDLPVNFLNSKETAEEYCQRIKTEAHQYNGFNLLVYANGELGHFSNYEGKINLLNPGVYGLSNALLDTPWPKVRKLKANFQLEIQTDFNEDSLFSFLEDRALADDHLLPDTGVGYDLEKMLSAVYIQSPKYGTCCSTIFTLSKDGRMEFTERTFAVGNRQGGQVHFKLTNES